jgi:hypothetical protein
MLFLKCGGAVQCFTPLSTVAEVNMLALYPDMTSAALLLAYQRLLLMGHSFPSCA